MSERDPEQRDESELDRQSVEWARQRAASDGDDFDALIRGASTSIPGYTITRPLSIGGQGFLYVATRNSDGSEVAVKLLKRSTLTDENDRLRYERELDVLKDLHHPGIVSILDSGNTSTGQRYLVMPLITGQVLNPGRLARSMPLDERLKLFIRIARAVGVAHRAGVVHRDLKPGNIQIDEAGNPWILDFGIATRIDKAELVRSMQVTGRIVGTPLWASFEQLRGEKQITPASDVFSLGIMLHQFLAGGRFPPQVLDLIHTAIDEAADSSANSRRPRRRGGDPIRPDLQRIIDRCMGFAPESRYANADALADAVERQLNAPSANTGPRAAVLVAAAAFVAVISCVWWLRVPVLEFDERSLYNADRAPLQIEGVTLIYIPPGTFTMGLRPEVGGLPDSKQRPASVAKGFYLGKTEISQGTYQRIMGKNPSKFTSNPGNPVERVSYADAQEFCRRLSEKTGKKVRLPTEIEWEYACRAGTTTDFSFGDDPKLMIQYGNLADQSNRDDPLPVREPWNDRCPNTAASGQFLSNRWHLSDMHGNVWEWCQGPYLIDPDDPGTVVESRAPARGGSWYDDTASSRAGHRNALPLETRTTTLGFRIACEE